MDVRNRYELFPRVCVCVCVQMYIYTLSVYMQVILYVFWECSVLAFFRVLRPADGRAPEQMWHLNGLLFGKQVAECDRS